MTAPTSLPASRPVRPTLLVLVAIVDLVFGVWDLIGSVFTIFLPAMMGFMARFMSALPRPPGNGPDPLAAFQAMSQVYSQGWVKAYLIGAGGLHFFIGIALCIAGVGLLRLQSWARATAFASAAAYLVVGFAGIVVGVIINIEMVRIQSASGAPSSLPMALFGTLFGLAFVLLVPAANFFALTRPDVKAALDGRPAPAQLAKTFE